MWPGINCAGLCSAGEVYLYHGDGFLAGDSYSVSRTGGVFGEEHGPGADASYLPVACFDFCFAGEVDGEGRMRCWTPLWVAG
jgi:hypothetical protein